MTQKDSQDDKSPRESETLPSDARDEGNTLSAASAAGSEDSGNVGPTDVPEPPALLAAEPALPWLQDAADEGTGQRSPGVESELTFADTEPAFEGGAEAYHRDDEPSGAADELLARADDAYEIPHSPAAGLVDTDERGAEIGATFEPGDAEWRMENSPATIAAVSVDLEPGPDLAAAGPSSDDFAIATDELRLVEDVEPEYLAYATWPPAGPRVADITEPAPPADAVVPEAAADAGYTEQASTAPITASAVEEQDKVPDALAIADVDVDAAPLEPTPVIVDHRWNHPPPLTLTPPWVWRDVEPDIVRDGKVPSLPDDEHVGDDPSPDSHEAGASAEARDDQDRPAPVEADAGGAWEVADDRRDAASLPPMPLATVEATATSQDRITLPWPHSVAARDSLRAVDEADIVASREPADWSRAKDIGRTALRYAGYAVAGYFALVFALILLYRVIDPPASSLMVAQALTGTDVHQEWVPLDEISPALVRAVIVSEDWSFCEHYGIDIKAIEEAIERSGNGIPRGASTISMQTTKNLFLWNAKSYIRKAIEVPLTLMIELVWPKRRILEIYLNVAEWGPGIFGAEAAAQYHFNKPASRLGEREAAQLAASLPNPIIREAGDPGPRTARKASVIQSRMRNAGGAAQCVLGGRR